MSLTSAHTPVTFNFDKLLLRNFNTSESLVTMKIPLFGWINELKNFRGNKKISVRLLNGVNLKNRQTSINLPTFFDYPKAFIRPKPTWKLLCTQFSDCLRSIRCTWILCTSIMLSTMMRRRTARMNRFLITSRSLSVLFRRLRSSRFESSSRLASDWSFFSSALRM